jgi:hypothetical protein
MNRKIHIEKLEIRTKNVSRGRARDIAGNLGGEILRRVSERTEQRSGTLQINRLDAGRIGSERAAGVPEIQNRIARKIADLIGERTDS